MSSNQERWHSGFGLLMASLGSAVGLGNIWRFSYVIGENGGGAFLLVYLALAALTGLPLLIAEFALGRSTGKESVGAIQAMSRSTHWQHLGLLGVFLSFLILSYYAVIASWVFKYFAVYLFQASSQLAKTGFNEYFSAFRASILEGLFFHSAGLTVVGIVVVAGIRKGIERVSMLLMPLLAILVVAMAIYSSTLPGFGQAATFLLIPDWEVLRDTRVYVAALGQILFSIGLATGILIAFGSYWGSQRHLPRFAIGVIAGDTLFAITAGFVIFPAVFSAGLAPAQGVGLVFAILPDIFEDMAHGDLIGLVFFLLLSIAGLTSMIAMLEVPVAYLTEKLGLSRSEATVLTTFSLFLIGSVIAVSHALDYDFLNTIDVISVEILLPLNAALLAIFVGWFSRRDQLIQATDLGPKLGCLWVKTLRYIVPITAIVVLVSGLISRINI